MNLEQMQSMWQAHSEKLDESMSLNKKLLQKIQAEGNKSELNKLILTRAIEGIVFFCIVLSLGTYMASSWSLTAPVVSAFVLNVFAVVGLAGSIGQIALLSKIDFSKPMKEILNDLIAVRTHSLNVFKLLILSAPFYMAYVFLGYDLFFGVDLFSLMSANTAIRFSVVGVIFGALAVLLVYKLKPENRTNKLIAWLYQEISGRRLTHLLDQFESMDKE
ncbi:hypothetical protein KUL113_15020 [Tenacibaculum sp. KUL113]|uniref:hypothetical protein n=1 Tax=Alteromonas sp. KUL150 TaxID=2480805 RepID=UPI0012E57753|nr:hypothetical protein [Alteromonas sp. KUL150]GFD72082.1 hypothetical protein KUL113_15020 [Tenacibaculum sp. KUL113]GFD87117.1 hypothetical protein KUL150_31760 [Alteromonas sp. KUL150]